MGGRKGERGEAGIGYMLSGTRRRGHIKGVTASERWKGKWNCTSCAILLVGATPMLTFNSFGEGISRGERNLKVLKLGVFCEERYGGTVSVELP